MKMVLNLISSTKATKIKKEKRKYKMLEPERWLTCDNLENEIFDFLSTKDDFVPLIRIYKEFMFIRPHEIDQALENLKRNTKVEKTASELGYAIKFKVVQPICVQ